MKRSALFVALGMCFAGAVSAQSNITGSIFGHAPAGAGTTVVIQNLDTGLTRTMQVAADGEFRVTALPNGRYKVTLQKDGQTVSVRDNIQVSIASGTEVSFAAADGSSDLATIEVIGAALPLVDVSQTDTRTVLTAEMLEKISIGQTPTDVAMLAPSVVRSDSYNGVPSFGGSAASENAYFINGYNVTNPLTSVGFTALPFDAIGEQQILTGGYGAEFGRSTGGVINIVTKRGSNEYKGGVYMKWTPESTAAAPRDVYYPVTGFYPYDGTNNGTDGQLNVWRQRNKSWQVTTGFYASGPLVKDRLFLYTDAETTKREGSEVLSGRFDLANSNPAQNGWREYRFNSPRWAGKMDWYITDNHLLEFTAIQDRTTQESLRRAFNYTTLTHATTGGSITTFDDNARMYVGKYTGYLTDDLIVSALYGTQDISHNNSLPSGYDPSCPQIVASTPTVRAPGVVYNNCQVSTSNALPLSQNEESTDGWRLDLNYTWGDHEFRLGYERQNADVAQHTRIAGGERWTYGRQGTPTTPISPIVGAPSTAGGLGAQGYYVARAVIAANSDPSVEQSSQYAEDRWHVTDNFLLTLGLRNEQFTNFDGQGRPYISQRHQLDPRVGFSWDMQGDSTWKLFGNVGRYHLATPNQAAIRGASASLNTVEYFTYTGTDPRTGAPTGLVRIPLTGTSTTICPGTQAISSNAECGTSPDPLTTTARDIKSHYQDEYIVGFENAFSPTFAWGAKATYRDLRSAIDDICGDALRSKCLNANPGETNTFLLKNADGSYTTVTLTAEEMGFPKLKRKYYAIDLFAEHPFANNWYGKFEYTFSKNWGNTEGQLASDLDTGAGGQADVGRTQDWDLWQLMVGSNGLLPNHRKHQVKAYGWYEWSDQWRTGATLIAASGRPKNCTSHFPQDSAALYNGAAYWFCGRSGNATTAPSADYAISPRGSKGEGPWSTQLNFNVAYVPTWADGKLTLQADIINVLNRQTAGAYNPRYENGSAADRRNTPNKFYGQEIQISAPRSLRLTARYDF
jgi:outer membrane receptor protein involved in Fe transport